MKYTHCDKEGHERGINNRGKPKSALLYRVDLVEGKSAFCTSMDIFGRVYNEIIPIDNLEKLDKEIER